MAEPKGTVEEPGKYNGMLEEGWDPIVDGDALAEL